MADGHQAGARGTVRGPSFVLAPRWLGLLVGAVVATTSVGATAWEQEISDHGVGLYWRSVVPFPVIQRAIPGHADGGKKVLMRAMQVWSRRCTGLRWARPDSGWVFPIILWQQGWPYGPGEAGHTQRFAHADSGRLKKVIIHLNGAFSFSGPRADGQGADLGRVLAHELGHVLGIGHSTVREALMYPGILPEYATSTSLSGDDTDALCSMYPKDVQLLSAADGLAYGRDSDVTAAPEQPADAPTKSRQLPVWVDLIAVGLSICAWWWWRRKRR